MGKVRGVPHGRHVTSMDHDAYSPTVAFRRMDCALRWLVLDAMPGGWILCLGEARAEVVNMDSGQHDLLGGNWSRASIVQCGCWRSNVASDSTPSKLDALPLERDDFGQSYFKRGQLPFAPIKPDQNHTLLAPRMYQEAPALAFA